MYYTTMVSFLQNRSVELVNEQKRSFISSTKISSSFQDLSYSSLKQFVPFWKGHSMNRS